MPEAKKTTKKAPVKKTIAKKTTTVKKAKVETVAKKDKAETVGSKMHNIFSGKYFYANGKRKTSVSRVRLYEKGKGKIIVNGKDYKEYFASAKESLGLLTSPLKTTGLDNQFDITIYVNGGGMVSQLDSARHGIAKALLVFDESLKTSLKSEGQIERDARKKERKKPGLKKARKAPTWVKR